MVEVRKQMDERTNRIINLAFKTTQLEIEDEYFIKKNYELCRDEIIDIATKKKVLPVVAKCFMNLCIDNVFWKEKYDYFKNRNREIIDFIIILFKTFNDYGIDKICVFENFGALLLSDTDIALYSSGDVDLFADITYKSQITDVLKLFDYYPLNDDKDNMNIMTEYCKKNGIIRINVAWKLLRRFAMPFKVNLLQYFDWEKTSFYKDTLIRIPEKNFLMYLCFLRIAVHGYSRSPDIRLYIDTYNSSCNNVDWELVENWAIRDNLKTKFYSTAIIANDLIKLNVPDKILENCRSDKYTKKILKICYDFDKHSLKYDPSGFNLLKMEAASDNKTLFGELFSMLFPSPIWIKEFYCLQNESVLKGLIKYYRRLI